MKQRKRDGTPGGILIIQEIKQVIEGAGGYSYKNYWSMLKRGVDTVYVYVIFICTRGALCVKLVEVRIS